MQDLIGYSKHFVFYPQSSENPLNNSSIWVNWSDLCFENTNLPTVWRMHLDKVKNRPKKTN